MKTEDLLFKFTSDLLTIKLDEVAGKVLTMRNNILVKHDSKITLGSDGRWTTRVHDSTSKSGFRRIRKTSREEVENEVIASILREERLNSNQLNANEQAQILESIRQIKPQKLSAPVHEREFGKTPEGHRISRNVTVGEFFYDWYDYKMKNPKLKAETFRKYRNDYRRYFPNSSFSKKRVQDIDYIDIESFLVECTLEYNLKKRAVSTLAGYIKGECDYAIRCRIITISPFNGVDLKTNVYPMCNDEVKPDEERILSAAEVLSLLDVLENRHLEAPDYMPDYAIEICLWSGLRVGEVVALSWSDIRNNELIITKSERRIPHDDRPDEYVIGDTKNHKNRVVPIGNELHAVFEKIRDVQRRFGFESEYIIADARGRIPAHHVTNAMYRRGKEAGVKACSIHAIRRTVSSRLNRIYDRATVAHIMGHTEEVNSLHYDYDTELLDKKRKTMDNLYND